MSENIRVRFAPSPTGQVHIGNVRVAVFNWLFARHQRGRFLLRVEDTDRERSTPEAVAALVEALDWLGLDHDEPPVYQSAQRARHQAAADRLLNLDHAYRNSDAMPATVFKIHRGLYDPAFVTDPGEDAVIDVGASAALRGTARSLVLVDRNDRTGREYVRPVPWDAIEADLVFHLDGGGTLPGDEVRGAVREKCAPPGATQTPSADAGADRSCDVHALTERPVRRVTFRRRYVFFDDLILGRRTKPLDDLRDFVLVRGDGSPVFHLANVVDDASMGVTHVLRGNDHLDNTFLHLFLWRAAGGTVPRYGHLPMIVNDQGRPYSKRDGDAYAGEFRAKGVLPEALFNFLALCGWSPGDDRERLGRDELVEAFSLDRVAASPARFDADKLAWLNSRYIAALPAERLRAELAERARAAGHGPEARGADWFARLAELYRERLRTLGEFPDCAAFFFTEGVDIAFEDKRVRKVLRKPEAREVLTDMRAALAEVAPWTEERLRACVDEYAAAHGRKLGAVAQPLRVAVTGGTASPGIEETLHLVGRERVLARLDAALAAIEARDESTGA